VTSKFGKHSPSHLRLCFVYYRVLPVSPPISAPKALLPTIEHGLKVPGPLFRKTFLYTLSMSEQAALFEIRFSGFNRRCSEGI
jgi:hypothetical protein